MRPEGKTRRKARMRNNRIRNKWTKRLFPIFALLILAPWPVAYAHNYTNDTAGQETIRIEAADPSVAPDFGNVHGKTIGGVTTPGDLFYIDAIENTADIQATLHIANAQELSRCYRYLILKVRICVKNGAGEWEKASMSDGKPIPDTFITMRGGQVSFTLPGLAEYKVTIDSGSYYCRNAVAEGGSVSPQLLLSVD